MKILSDQSKEKYGRWEVLVDYKEAEIQKYDILLYLTDVRCGEKPFGAPNTIYVVGKAYQVKFELSRDGRWYIKDGPQYFIYEPDPSIEAASQYRVFLQDDSLGRNPHPKAFHNAIRQN